MSPKVLVISNTALNISNSNGRTLGLLLSGIKKKNLMQFCVKNEPVSCELIQDAYCVSDSMILKEVFSRRILSKKLQVADKIEAMSGKSHGAKKTALKYLVRELAWSIKIGCTDFEKRALEFQPNVILFQMGTAGFLADLASNLSRRCNAKIIVFTTEDYYFKAWNFIQPHKRTCFFGLYMARYRRSVERLFQSTAVCIANTPALAEKYAQQFGVKVEVIMAAASESIASHFSQQENTVVYAGNLSLNRYQAIIEVAKTISQIDSDMVVAVYGQTTPEIENEFRKYKNIIIKGFVAYDSLLPRIANAKLLLHCESFDEFYRKDLQSAFSTKIADSLASGVPLLLFAPEEFSETIYLNKEQCAIVCTDAAELETYVKRALNEEKLRLSVIGRANLIAEKNHSLRKNQKKMYGIITAICGPQCKKGVS